MESSLDDWLALKIIFDNSFLDICDRRLPSFLTTQDFVLLFKMNASNLWCFTFYSVG